MFILNIYLLLFTLGLKSPNREWPITYTFFLRTKCKPFLRYYLILTYKSYKDVEATNWAVKIHMLVADNKKLHCYDHISISPVFPQFKSTSFHVSFLSQVKMNSLNWSASPKIWVFIAQLVEHCSTNAEAMGFESRWSSEFYFSGLKFAIY